MLRGGVVEYAIEGLQEQGVGIEAENAVVVGQCPELEFGKDGCPGDAADTLRDPVDYDVLDRDDLGSFLFQEVALVLCNIRRYQNEEWSTRIVVACVDGVPDLVI